MTINDYIDACIHFNSDTQLWHELDPKNTTMPRMPAPIGGERIATTVPPALPWNGRFTRICRCLQEPAGR